MNFRRAVVLLAIVTVLAGCSFARVPTGPWCTEIQAGIALNLDPCLEHQQRDLALTGDLECVSLPDVWLDTEKVYRVYLEGIADSPGVAHLGPQERMYSAGRMVLSWDVVANVRPIDIPVCLEGKGTIELTAFYVVQIPGSREPVGMG